MQRVILNIISVYSIITHEDEKQLTMSDLSLPPTYCLSLNLPVILSERCHFVHGMGLNATACLRPKTLTFGLSCVVIASAAHSWFELFVHLDDC